MRRVAFEKGVKESSSPDDPRRGRADGQIHHSACTDRAEWAGPHQQDTKRIVGSFSLIMHGMRYFYPL